MQKIYSCMPIFCTFSVAMVTYMYISPGPQNVNVIKWCACDRSERLNRCRRLHKWMVYFPDTPNERAVNVGHCAGNSVCRDDQGVGFFTQPQTQAFHSGFC